MAWTNDYFPGSSGLIRRTTALQPGTVGTVHFRFKPLWAYNDILNHVLFCYGDLTNLGSYAGLSFQKHTDNNIYIGWEGDGGHGGDQRISTAADAAMFTSGTWATHVFTWDDSADDCKYYVDNTQKGSRTSTLTTQTISGAHTLMNYGNGQDSAVHNANGSMCEWARWNRVLTADERAILQAGMSPATIPNGLVEYLPMIRLSPEIDIVSGGTYTVTGSTVADHSRVFYRRKVFGSSLPSIDNTNRDDRASMVGIDLPFVLVLPNPDGLSTFDSGDFQQLAGKYRGIISAGGFVSSEYYWATFGRPLNA